MYMQSLSRVVLGLTLLAAAVPACADGTDFSVRVTPFDQVYPALELSQARVRGGGAGALPPDTFGAGSGLIGVRLRAHHAGERVRIAIAAPPRQAPATLEAPLPLAGRDYELRPPLPWDPARLRTLAAPSDAALRFELWRDDVAAGE